MLFPFFQKIHGNSWSATNNENDWSVTKIEILEIFRFVAEKKFQNVLSNSFKIEMDLLTYQAVKVAAHEGSTKNLWCPRNCSIAENSSDIKAVIIIEKFEI